MTRDADPERDPAPAGPPQGRGAPQGEAAEGRVGGNTPAPAGPSQGRGAPWREANEVRIGGATPSAAPPHERDVPPEEAAESRGGGIGRIRWVGLSVLALLTLLLAWQPPFIKRQQLQWYDATQRLLPRTMKAQPATIVAVDQKSMVALGQWPWPRTVLAQLVREIQHAKPASIGLDILMSESDRSSPEHWLDNMPTSDADLAQALEALPSHDAELARALGASRVVLGMAGTPEPTGMLVFATPILVEGAAKGDAVAAHGKVVRYGGALTNLQMFERVAAGHGLLSAETEEGVVRRVPMIASIEGTLVPSFTMEMLRVAVKAPVLRVKARDSGIASLSAGTFAVPTESDGAIRIHYSPHDPRRFVSAIDVLQGRADLEELAGKLVIVGMTGVVQVDYQETPLGDRMPGVEIHAQLLENIYEGGQVQRPSWARYLEVALFVALGALLTRAAPLWRTPATVSFAVASMVVPALAALGAFAWGRLQFDALSPALAMLALFATLLALTLGEASRDRRSLRRQMQSEREQSARISGEMEAAQRVQVAMLPRDDAFRDERRLDLAATMVPAREVGGDLYDFFRLDGRRWFFLIGDVAGKGLSASIFMAVSKALAKSAAVRHPDDDVGAWMTAANREITRENSDGLFVTLFAGILDLDSGDLVYANAGHDAPYGVGIRSGLRRLDAGDGPPLCTVDDYEYRGEHTFVDPDELLVLVTDGITDMRDPSGAMYGRARMEAVLEKWRAHPTGARGVVDALREDAQAFAAGAEPADDVTVLAFRWTA
ncbi:MAG: CHASE2 domain-containing protein [Betaproteobacteria bacterium]